MAFLDDVYMASDPDRVGRVYATVQDSLWEEAGIRIHVVKTKVWNAAGIRIAISTSWREWPRNGIHRPECGGAQGSPSSSKGPKSWEPHSVAHVQVLEFHL